MATEFLFSNLKLCDVLHRNKKKNVYKIMIQAYSSNLEKNKLKAKQVALSIENEMWAKE